jgi:c-di-GMP-binding flagellar brake protein YcgR
MQGPAQDNEQPIGVLGAEYRPGVAGPQQSVGGVNAHDENTRVDTAACCPVNVPSLIVPTSERVEKTDLFNPGGEGDFWVRSRKEVLVILSRLKNKVTTVTAYFDRNQSFILTAVLGLLKDRDVLVLDEGPSDELNLKLLQSGQASCVTVHDRIRIRFDCANLKRARYKGRSVLVCPIPRELLYLERRECFRVAASVVHPPVCYVPQPEQEPLKLLVVDISVGGLGLYNLNRPMDVKSEDSCLYCGCRLHLPDFAKLTVDLRVQNIRRVVHEDGKEAQKIGAKFMYLRPGDSNHIQQYVNSIQLKQIAMTRR